MENYKELLAKIEGLHELMTTRFDSNDDDHEKIIKRMDIANGRTSKNESKISKLENWRWYLVGIFSVGLFIFTLALNLYEKSLPR